MCPPFSPDMRETKCWMVKWPLRTIYRLLPDMPGRKPLVTVGAGHWQKLHPHWLMLNKPWFCAHILQVLRASKMKAFISTVTVLWVITIPCMEALHGLYNFGQHEFFYKKNNCKPIPANLLLCHDIEYTEMRLPNLLGHETMNEVLQQASSWIPLVQKQCHPDTRKFLCSLFAPVCLDDLDEPIQPCRSLCESVKHGCAPVMSAFGFPWPKMLDCDRFPLDNDLCIPPVGIENFAPATKEGK